MTRFAFLLALGLVGCGGEEFSEELFSQPGVGGSETGGATAGTGGEATGGAQETGGAMSTGGSFQGTGGSSQPDDGGTGGSPSTGGASDTGGTPNATGGTASTGGAAGCTLVTHDNGMGQTWQDCEPLGTYTQAQAMKACTASGATTCLVRAACGPVSDTVRGYNTAIIAEWGYDSSGVGAVSPGDGQGGLLGAICLGTGYASNSTWN